MKKIEKPESLLFYMFDGVEVTAVYAGDMGHLEYINKRLEWKEDEKDREYGMGPHLTLKEISDQLKDKIAVITVVCEDPLGGVIYQYGNYSDNSWWQIGELAGYA